MPTQPDLILSRLKQAGHNFVTADELVDALYGNCKMPDNPYGVLTTLISGLRARGINVKRVSGYRLAPR